MRRGSTKGPGSSRGRRRAWLELGVYVGVGGYGGNKADEIGGDAARPHRVKTPLRILSREMLPSPTFAGHPLCTLYAQL